MNRLPGDVRIRSKYVAEVTMHGTKSLRARK